MEKDGFEEGYGKSEELGLGGGVVEVGEVVEVFVKGFFYGLDHLWLAEGEYEPNEWADVELVNIIQNPVNQR